MYLKGFQSSLNLLKVTRQCRFKMMICCRYLWKMASGPNGNTIIQPDFSATPNLAPHTTHPPCTELEVPLSNPRQYHITREYHWYLVFTFKNWKRNISIDNTIGHWQYHKHRAAIILSDFSLARTHSNRRVPFHFISKMPQCYMQYLPWLHYFALNDIAIHYIAKQYSIPFAISDETLLWELFLWHQIPMSHFEFIISV